MGWRCGDLGRARAISRARVDTALGFLNAKGTEDLKGTERGKGRMGSVCLSYGWVDTALGFFMQRREGEGREELAGATQPSPLWALLILCALCVKNQPPSNSDARKMRGRHPASPLWDPLRLCPSALRVFQSPQRKRCAKNGGIPPRPAHTDRNFP